MSVKSKFRSEKIKFNPDRFSYDFDYYDESEDVFLSWSLLMKRLLLKGMIFWFPLPGASQKIPPVGIILKDTDPKSLNYYEITSGVKYYTKCTMPNAIALTFDDGPSSQQTGTLLDILKRQSIKATFFIIGSLLENDSAAAAQTKRAVEEGHTIASHTFSHTRVTLMSLQQVQDEITRTAAAIQKITGSRVRYFRPPYGEIPAAAAQRIQEMGYVLVNWNFDSLDWSILNEDSNFAVAQQYAKPDQTYIILYHDIYGETVRTIERIIQHFKSLNYRFVTMDECLGSGVSTTQSSSPPTLSTKSDSASGSTSKSDPSSASASPPVTSPFSNKSSSQFSFIRIHRILVSRNTILAFILTLALLSDWYFE